MAKTGCRSFADEEGRFAHITVDFHTRSVTIEVDLVLFTAGDTGKIETLSVYTGALIVRVHVCALAPALTAPTTGDLSRIEPRHRIMASCQSVHSTAVA